MEPPATFAEWLSRARDASRYSLRDLGAEIGVSHGYISKFENTPTPPEQFAKKPPRDFVEGVARVTGADARLGMRLAGWAPESPARRDEARGTDEWRRRVRAISDKLAEMGPALRDRLLETWEEQIEPHYRLFQELSHQQEEVQRFGEFMRSLGDGAAPAVDIFWEMDAARVFLHFAGPGVAALGLREGEVVGRSVEEVIAARPDLFEPDLLPHVKAALAGGLSHWTKEVGGRAIDVQAFPYRDGGGEIVGIIGASRFLARAQDKDKDQDKEQDEKETHP